MDGPPPLPSRVVPPRLPGTYTAGHGRDANARVGRIVFLVLAVLCLGLQGVDFLYIPHAGVVRLLVAAGRVVISWTCFIAVAGGVNWARWPLAFIHVGLGLWLWVHAMMGTFAAAYPAISGSLSSLPFFLGVLFLGAGGWFGLSADLSAYLDRARTGMTSGSRLVTAALLAVVLGVPAAGGGLFAILTFHRIDPEHSTRTEPIPLPPQNDDGARFALELIQRAVQAKDFSVFTAEMSPTIKAQTTAKWVQQVSADLARRGPPVGFRFSDAVFNVSYDQQRELTYCNVFAVYDHNSLCFHCNLSREIGAKVWQVDMVFIE